MAAGAGGGTGRKAPPGTADATGLSDPSAATEDTPNTQSSTRMWGNLNMLGPTQAGCLPVRQLASKLIVFAETRIDCSQFDASVRRQRTM